MAERVYGFNEEGFKRVQEATRRTLGTPRVGSQRRRQVPVLSGSGRGGSGTDGTDGGGGFLSASCDCLPMVNLPGDPSVCCEGSLMFETASVFLGAKHELKYNPDDQWSTDPAGFEFDECLIGDGEEAEVAVNKYRITITASAEPWDSTMQVELVEDNGCPVICALYKSPYPFRCGCENQFVRVTFNNIAANRLPCTIVIKPKSTSFVITPQDWGNDVLCGIIPAEDLPLGWTYDHDDFEGARCLVPGQRDYLFKYSGEWSGDGFNPGFTLWGNVNAPRGFPLLRSSGFGFWQSPDVHDADGVLYAATPAPMYTRTTLDIRCVGTSLRFELKIRVPRVPVTAASGDTAGFVTYTKSIDLSEVGPHEVACILNAEHTLTTPPITNTDPGNEWCPGEYDPVFDPINVPTSVTISPFGGGPEECPNPDNPTYGDPPTTEGYCGSPCTTPTAEPDPDGEETCCVDSVCFDDLTGTDCTDIGGELIADCADCEQESACCHEGSCYHMTRTECISMVGHEFSFHEGELCSEVDCGEPPPTSCCGSCGSCTDGATAEDCAAELFHASACSGVTCPENVGACCVEGVCTIRSSGNCPGEYLGNCTTCEDGCPGACCHGFLTPTNCTYETEAECNAEEFTHVWMGAGVPCDPCPP